jgi:hypothetical protein
VRGRGIFVVDASKPARLHAPENLLVPTSDLDLRDGRLVVKATSSVGARERAFFEALQEHFGWSAGGRDKSWRAQAHWSELPKAVIERIQTMGMQQDLGQQFLAPTEEIAASHYVRERRINYRDHSWMMPLIDLVNHCSFVDGYVFRAGVGVAGTFDDEMLVRYNINDAWTRALAHGFAEPTLHAYSIGIALDIFGNRISIGRELKQSEVRDGVVYPKAEIEDATIALSFLALGVSRAATFPRAVFRAVVSPNLTSEQADEAFDNIAHFNRMAFLGLLRTLGTVHGEVPTMLREAITMHLEAMSHCIGARLS